MIFNRKLCLVFLLAASGLMLIVTVYAQTSHQKQQFIKKIDVASQAANANILKQRHKLLTLYRSWQKNHKLGFFEKRWIKEEAKAYRIKKFNEKKSEEWRVLIRRVDVVPNSLAISQAIIESNWGQSRFAQQGNNYFGIHCHRKGCGIVPLRRHPKSSFEVRNFENMEQSTESYMRVLNSQPAFLSFRTQRMKLRKKEKILNGYNLTGTLEPYSESTHYPNLVRKIMIKYKLDRFDR